MSLQPDDTDPEAERAYIELLRRMPVWKRARRVNALTNARRAFILADLRRRHPHADDEELRKRFAARVLPREDVIRIFDWDPEKEGY
jgi:hypothetical protein